MAAEYAAHTPAFSEVLANRATLERVPEESLDHSAVVVSLHVVPVIDTGGGRALCIS